MPYRMTYERAGLMYRAMMLKMDACAQVSIRDVIDMGLRLPSVNPTFAEFLDHNADKLQLFDEEVYHVAT